MSYEMATEAVKTITKELKRNFPAKGMKEIWPDLIKQPDAAISAAADHFCLNSSYLPSPQQFLDRVRLHAKEIAKKDARQREIEWAETKGGETPEQIRRQGSIFTSEQQDAHARHAVQAIMLMLSNAPMQDKLGCFKAMDQSYPSVGWALNGAQLLKYRETRCATCSVPSKPTTALHYGCYGPKDCKAYDPAIDLGNLRVELKRAAMR